jgi:hypothetical protein
VTCAVRRSLPIGVGVGVGIGIEGNETPFGDGDGQCNPRGTAEYISGEIDADSDTDSDRVGKGTGIGCAKDARCRRATRRQCRESERDRFARPALGGKATCQRRLSASAAAPNCSLTSRVSSTTKPSGTETHGCAIWMRTRRYGSGRCCSGKLPHPGARRGLYPCAQPRRPRRPKPCRPSANATPPIGDNQCRI